MQNNKQPIFTENGEKQQAAQLFSKWPPADAESKGLSAKTGVAGAMIRGFFRLCPKKKRKNSAFEYFSSKEVAAGAEIVFVFVIVFVSALNLILFNWWQKKEDRRAAATIRECPKFTLQPVASLGVVIIYCVKYYYYHYYYPGVSKVYSQSRAREP